VPKAGELQNVADNTDTLYNNSSIDNISFATHPPPLTTETNSILEHW